MLLFDAILKNVTTAEIYLIQFVLRLQSQALDRYRIYVPLDINLSLLYI